MPRALQRRVWWRRCRSAVEDPVAASQVGRVEHGLTEQSVHRVVAVGYPNPMFAFAAQYSRCAALVVTRSIDRRMALSLLSAVHP
jgi:hypothetical protein